MVRDPLKLLSNKSSSKVVIRLLWVDSNKPVLFLMDGNVDSYLSLSLRYVDIFSGVNFFLDKFNSVKPGLNRGML